MSAVYLVKRGERPEHHNTPYHRVIICGKKAVAHWEAGWSGDRAWLWSHERGSPASGWLVRRWNGLDVDYGHVVRGFGLPDGSGAGFVHEHTGREPWPLLAGAVWWDDKRVPKWLAESGVIYPPDRSSQQRILDRISDDGCSGFGRATPEFWPEPAPRQTVVLATDGPRIPNGARVRWPRTSRPGASKWGEVLRLTAEIEEPNGRWDRYRVRWEDGRESELSRSALESHNADLVADAPAAGGL